MTRTGIIAFAFLFVAPATLIADPILSLAAPAPPVASGASFTVGADIQTQLDISGFQFDLTFNPAVLSVASATEGGSAGTMLEQ